MEEEDTKPCTNCKREIPAVNFTTHSVHCARNLRACPVCKEPVPTAQLQAHHDALHKEVPCKKCGESVCGTDLEDHIRDSCAQTFKPCRYCDLELPRRSLPAHESYCGARSEQCPDCREYVMAKYRQLHLDSNHGFLRLDDDPTPIVEKPKPKPITNGVPLPSTSRNGTSRARLVTDINYYETQGSSAGEGSGRNGRVTVKRCNDQPQINTSVQPTEKVNKELPSRGAVKKRPAPPPPPVPDARRDNAYHSALRRKQQEEKHRQEETAYNLSVGLPPVISPAEKLDKLRKMDALHNREVDPQEWRSKLQGRVWQPADVAVGHVLGAGPPARAPLQDLSHLQPMTPAQFMNRFQELQLGEEADRRGAGAEGAGAAGGDRFSEIKSSLRELRRGLNEVTAPYNSASNASNNTIIDSNRLCPPSPPPGAGAGAAEALRLPCEFCAAAVPADDLVLHQTGCRPDLTQYKPASRSPLSPRRFRPRPPRAHPVPPMEDPVIPCEFCTESLPVYLISEHQERCRRETNILFPD